MMRKILMSMVMLLGMSAIPAAAATTAVATANVNLRAGPSTSYPVVTVVPAGARIVTHGCLSGYTWCDISLGTYRGWVAASYVQVMYNGAPIVVTAPVAATVGITVVAFNKTYWDNYYVGYPWYGRWAAYPPYAPYAPRVTSHSRDVNCANGSCTGTRSTTGIYGGSTSQTRTCADGTCTSTRNTTGAYGNSASRTRTCTRAGDPSCTVTRTGPRGGTATGTRVFHR